MNTYINVHAHMNIHVHKKDNIENQIKNVFIILEKQNLNARLSFFCGIVNPY